MHTCCRACRPPPAVRSQITHPCSLCWPAGWLAGSLAGSSPPPSLLSRRVHPYNCCRCNHKTPKPPALTSLSRPLSLLLLFTHSLPLPPTIPFTSPWLARQQPLLSLAHANHRPPLPKQSPVLRSGSDNSLCTPAANTCAAFVVPPSHHYKTPSIRLLLLLLLHILFSQSLLRTKHPSLHLSEKARIFQLVTAAMDLPAASRTTATRSRRSERRGDRGHHSSSSSSQSSPPTYGYHNTFHTHAPLVLASPPSYAQATSPATLAWLNAKASAEATHVRRVQAPPPYTCTVELQGVMGMRMELSNIFEIARGREWTDVYVVLRGTQLSIHRIKTPGILSKSRVPTAGRLLKTFTLQHAEIGVASDFRKTSLIPKSPFAHLVPASARAKLYESDPHLFEPVREHVLRLRLETDQFLLCANDVEDLLTWAEKLCAAIDISPPIEDRSEPRYRSLPRRNRRQRVLDGSQLGENLENLSSLEAGRRIIAEQEAIIRELYPHLAAQAQAEGVEETAPASQGADPDRDEFDADDVRFPMRSSAASRSASRDGETGDESRPSSSEAVDVDPKNAPIVYASHAQILRYRRRCAPVLLACSPRVSDVVIRDGERVRINTRETILEEYTSHPPRYDAHQFPKIRRTPKPIEVVPQITSTVPITSPITLERPSSPLRGISDDSITSFGYDLASTSSGHQSDNHSDHHSDQIRSAAPSEPPSPTALTQVKADANRQLAAMGKRRHSEEQRENGMGTMTLGMPLYI
ncbi:unnamed protein product [Periconia digitata]|uniref:PH domain-containing protein n=1 Tax=Periconia digitata TaxID=1303443 RepID=A0A9W4UL72_9PLEO|nr:unnamed protein product [Periconia digitata]